MTGREPSLPTHPPVLVGPLSLGNSLDMMYLLLIDWNVLQRDIVNKTHEYNDTKTYNNLANIS